MSIEQTVTDISQSFANRKNVEHLSYYYYYNNIIYLLLLLSYARIHFNQIIYSELRNFSFHKDYE